MRPSWVLQRRKGGSLAARCAWKSCQLRMILNSAAHHTMSCSAVDQRCCYDRLSSWRWLLVSSSRTDGCFGLCPAAAVSGVVTAGMGPESCLGVRLGLKEELEHRSKGQAGGSVLGTADMATLRLDAITHLGCMCVR